MSRTKIIKMALIGTVHDSVIFANPWLSGKLVSMRRITAIKLRHGSWEGRSPGRLTSRIAVDVPPWRATFPRRLHRLT